jgi:glycosyltransferase involved in cell wall biosynthesis
VRRFLIIAYTTYMHDGRVKRHAEALAERGDHVDVISLAVDNEPPASPGINVIGLQMPRYRGASRSAYLKSYFRFFAAAADKALRLALKQRYEVVIVCTMPDAVIITAILPKLLGSKIVLDVHDTMPELYRDKFGGTRGAVGAKLLMFEERMSAWWADRILAVHDLHKERLEQAGVPRDKIRVVTNSPDPRIFVPHRNGVGSRDFTIACHGTLTHRMGLDLAIQALAMLRERHPALRLLVVGHGDYASEARDLARNLQLENRVSFNDVVPVEKLPEALSIAQIGLVPNKPSSATHLMLPVKMLDYATLGIPVISSRLRTVEHYFGDGAVEFFEPGNVCDLARAIERLYLNPILRAERAQRAHKVIDALSWESQRNEYYKVIDSLLPNHRYQNRNGQESL